MADDTKTDEYRAGDVTTWSLNGLLMQLDAYRGRLDAGQHDTVRTTVQLLIDGIIAELDRRNREAMAVS